VKGGSYFPLTTNTFIHSIFIDDNNSFFFVPNVHTHWSEHSHTNLNFSSIF